MLHSPRRRSAVALTSLLALAAALLMPLTAARAADPISLVTVADSLGDTPQVQGSANEPKADITAASARYQNDLVTFTMNLATGDDLSSPTGENQLYWYIMDNAGNEAWVSLTRDPNGLGEVVMGEPYNSPAIGDPSRHCPGSMATFDVSAGTYSASVPASCIGSPASFQWWAYRQSATSNGAVSGIDTAPDDGFAAAVTNTKVTGYWAMGSDGIVYKFGDAPLFGSAPSSVLSMVDIEASPHGTGYWTMDSKGVVGAFGPPHFGNVTNLKANERAVSISGTPTGAGYWVFTNLGRVVAFGDANKNLGDVSSSTLNGEILDSSSTPSGNGYYMVGSDGGVFTQGDANFEGSMGGFKLNQPVQSIVPDPDGIGYWLVASDGGVFSFKAPFRGSTGSLKLNKPMTGMVPYGDGYLMVAEDGGVFNFSNLPFSGSLGNNPPTNAIVSITALS